MQQLEMKKKKKIEKEMRLSVITAWDYFEKDKKPKSNLHRFGKSVSNSYRIDTIKCWELRRQTIDRSDPQTLFEYV